VVSWALEAEKEGGLILLRNYLPSTPPLTKRGRRSAELRLPMRAGREEDGLRLFGNRRRGTFWCTFCISCCNSVLSVVSCCMPLVVICCGHTLPTPRWADAFGGLDLTWMDHLDQQVPYLDMARSHNVGKLLRSASAATTQNKSAMGGPPVRWRFLPGASHKQAAYCSAFSALRALSFATHRDACGTLAHSASAAFAARRVPLPRIALLRTCNARALQRLPLRYSARLLPARLPLLSRAAFSARASSLCARQAQR